MPVDNHPSGAPRTGTKRLSASAVSIAPRPAPRRWARPAPWHAGPMTFADDVRGVARLHGMAGGVDRSCGWPGRRPVQWRGCGTDPTASARVRREGIASRIGDRRCGARIDERHRRKSAPPIRSPLSPCPSDTPPSRLPACRAHRRERGQERISGQGLSQGRACPSRRRGSGLVRSRSLQGAKEPPGPTCPTLPPRSPETGRVVSPAAGFFARG